jgi:hypothetical protein
MALAAIMIDVLKQTGGGGGGGGQFSWISKAVGTGVNKHGGWIIAAVLLWRRLC